MFVKTFDIPKFNEHYEGAYSERELEWRRVVAIDKASHLQALLGSRRVESVLEVGCGTGAVLAEVARRGIGTRHTGVDIADPSAHVDPGAVEMRLMKYDGATLPFPDNSFDLVFASHVVEHTFNPRGFISELSRIAKGLIYLEVPCELHLRATQEAVQIALDIGHINPYTPKSFCLLCQTTNLKVIDIRLFDHSLNVHKFDRSAFRAIARMAVRRTLLRLNQSIASRFFTYHCGALCAPANKLGAQVPD